MIHFWSFGIFMTWDRWQHGSEDFNVNRIEEQAAQLEKDLMIKEQETLDVLKQLEAAKRFVEALKMNLIVPKFSSFFVSPDLNLASYMNYSNENLSMSPQKSSGSMSFELDRAKLNLSKTSTDLALIQESVESLNKKMRKEKFQVPDSEGVLFSRNTVVSCTNAAMEVRRVDFEADQFKKMTEASRYEVTKAMAEIERTKNSIKMAEMRINAAKKMEEAAKAIEAIAIYEKHTENSSDVLEQSNGITLSCEEYRLLTRKAQQVDPDTCKTKFIDSDTIPSKHEGSEQENRYSKFKFRNSRNAGHRNRHASHENGSHGTSATTSMGDILGRRVILQDKMMVGSCVATDGERENASLSQMLREQSRLILHPGESRGELDVEKSACVVPRKKFGFIQVPLSVKRTKKRTQPSLNVS